jgi:hypothetical protein
MERIFCFRSKLHEQFYAQLVVRVRIKFARKNSEVFKQQTL